ncbi:MAG: hypothetical protein ACKVOJ_03395 [Sphingomonadaceae bacterium]
MSPRTPLFALIAVGAVLSGCARDGEIDSTGGISITRSACPAIAVPAFTGDVTFFNPPASRDARAIDVVATLTNVRSTCADVAADVAASVTFDVQAQRASAQGPRDIVIPYFASVVQAGRLVVSKSVSRIAVHFDDGQLRATAKGTAGATVSRAAATLPKDVRDRVTRKRKAGDDDAAIDPLADPTVRDAVAKASFELLIGFQLTQEQLQYNATR